MLQIDSTIISLDILEEKFKCDFNKCKGNCCVYGDSGALLEKEEVEILNVIFPKIKPFLRPQGIDAIKRQGTSMVDKDGDHVTPLIKGKECAYTFLEKGIYRCGIEKAFLYGKVHFRKPLSCHLFPVRVKKFRDFDGVNYEKWDMCSEGRDLGNEGDIMIFEFLSEPLIRRFGIEWYKKLKLASKELKQEKVNKSNK